MSNKLDTRIEALDSRTGAAGFLRTQINKVFPTHWSFMLGEIALYAFVVLLLTGIYLALFFEPSAAKVIYDGAYSPLNGIEMSRAYETALNLSFEVRGGLFLRQMHHWAALLFSVAIMVHMFRIFFTGAFRRPREANWIIGCFLLLLCMGEGFFGYSLPDDLLSGVGLRIMSAIIMSIPVIGTWIHWFMFGGDFPSDIMLSRFYILHVLLLPGIILALVGAHVALVWFQKHTQYPGPGRTEKNVVGVRILPLFGLKASAFGLATFGVIALMAGVFTINPIWAMGPYNPAQVSAGSQPDIYMLWTDGLARIMPAWELYLGRYTVPAVFWVALVALIFISMALFYPWIEKAWTGDDAAHNILQRPRDVPVRTSLGVVALGAFFLLTLSGANDLFAHFAYISLNAMTWFGRIGIAVLPPVIYFVTYRICIGLQRSDREVLEHGVATGQIIQTPEGGFLEIHQPIGPVDEHGHQIPLEYQGARVPKKANDIGFVGRAGRGSWLKADPESIAEQAYAIEEANERERFAVLSKLNADNMEADRQAGLTK